MTKEKNKSVIAVRNRNNRKRGSQFEKKIASILDMNVVPYSGTNSQFGWSDVRDSEVKSRAWWMGECKNMTIDDDIFVIQHDWIEKMEARAYDTGSLPFLAFMQASKPQKYILMNKRTVGILEATMGKETILHSIQYTKASCKSVNLRIPLADLKQLDKKVWQTMRCRLGDEPWYYIVTIETFIKLLQDSNMHYKWATGGE